MKLGLIQLQPYSNTVLKSMQYCCKSVTVRFMKVLIQRVSHAKVLVNDKVKGQIGKGLLIFLAIEKNDDGSQVDYLVDKITNLRIFENSEQKLELSLKDIAGEVLAVSQFTLCGSCEKGRRPDFFGAAAPFVAKKMYQDFIDKLKSKGFKVDQGVFGAYMKVDLENDGPSTFILEKR